MITEDDVRRARERERTAHARSREALEAWMRAQDEDRDATADHWYLHLVYTYGSLKPWAIDRLRHLTEHAHSSRLDGRGVFSVRTICPHSKYYQQTEAALAELVREGQVRRFGDRYMLNTRESALAR